MPLRGGGGKGRAIQEKRAFSTFFPTAIKLEWVGVKVFMALPLKKNKKSASLKHNDKLKIRDNMEILFFNI